jgi:hypothetical protein
MRYVFLAALAACFIPPRNPPAGSTEPIGDAFHCTFAGRCFTTIPECMAHGDCARSDRAWCSVYSENGTERLACSMNRSDCNLLVKGLREHAWNHGECVERVANKR